jgi:lysine 6-dehydrogenase
MEGSMKVLSIGAAGKMGKAVVAYFVHDPEAETVGLLDAQGSVLKSMVKDDSQKKLRIHSIDLEDVAELKKVMQQYDVAVVTLPNRKLSYGVMEAAIDAGLDLVDVLEEYHRRPDIYQTEGFVLPTGCSNFEEYGEQMHAKAVRNNVLILDGMGFAPGLSNIATARGISQLDQANSVVARVGGIPNLESSAAHPLRYMTTWSLEHVLREYSIRTQIIRNGRKVEVAALEDPETFRFTEFGIDEDLECAVTPGMPSFVHTNPNLQYFAEKTVRWPGHYQGVKTLLECGLLDEKPLDYHGTQIAPKEFLLRTINPLLVPQEGEGDVCVMYVSVEGTKDGKPRKLEYFMWEQPAGEFSGMARVTGYPAAIGAKLVASGRIDLKGIRAPEECVVGKEYDWFIGELKKKDITIKEKSSAL